MMFELGGSYIGGEERASKEGLQSSNSPPVTSLSTCFGSERHASDFV